MQLQRWEESAGRVTRGLGDREKFHSRLEALTESPSLSLPPDARGPADLSVLCLLLLSALQGRFALCKLGRWGGGVQVWKA